MVRGKGSFVQIVDGKHTGREMLEVWFGQDTLHQKFDTAIALRGDVTALPDINGAGNVRDLWQAASMETAESSGCRLVPAADRSRFIRLSKPFDGVRNKQRTMRGGCLDGLPGQDISWNQTLPVLLKAIVVAPEVCMQNA
ncbi:hypothetical protein [Paraburkholderia bonniea]|uniref:hypothetical protein n=1 Tax=Paraburkholderia bonniea TaxID=2152891 RepID=UPI0012909D01|nr:hypothetical protein [Paraburkholderia bonniea]